MEQYHCKLFISFVTTKKDAVIKRGYLLRKILLEFKFLIFVKMFLCLFMHLKKSMS